MIIVGNVNDRTPKSKLVRVSESAAEEGLKCTYRNSLPQYSPQNCFCFPRTNANTSADL